MKALNRLMTSGIVSQQVTFMVSYLYDKPQPQSWLKADL